MVPNRTRKNLCMINERPNKSVSVIVSKTAWSVTAKCYVTYGDRLVDSTYSTAEYANPLESAREEAEAKIAKGVSVVLRPDYNEQDQQGRFFREWRSFDGGPLEECIFRAP